MQIIHKIDDFFFNLFPDAKKDEINNETIISKLKDYYSFGPFQPKVEIRDDLAIITINSDLIIKHNTKFNNIVRMCETGKYEPAKEQLYTLIKEAPFVSEYHRILGQIYSDEGDHDKAVDSLIDALKCDPQNVWALIMMGNVFARGNDDIEGGMRFYERALEVNPTDNIALNNIGANLMRLQRFEEALPYFEKAYRINRKYPNTLYALAMIEMENENHLKSFQYAIEGIKSSVRKDELYKNTYALAIDSARKYRSTGIPIKIVEKYIEQLENSYNVPIKLEEDSKIPTAAKIEFAGNHNRNFHLIKYNRSYSIYEHLIMHELVHLEFANEARKEHKNKLFVTDQITKNEFIYSLKDHINKLSKQGYDENQIKQVFGEIFDGLNRQIYNTPIDVFIEHYLFQTYSELNPAQFLSILEMVSKGKDATTNEKIVELNPDWIVEKSKIYNLVNAYQLKDLYGLDLLDDFKPSSAELKKAHKFYQEYERLKDSRKAGQEYDLVLSWAQSLDLENYFSLIDEEKYRKQKTVDEVFSEIDSDPINAIHDDPVREKEMQRFIDEHSKCDINPAVMMYMVGALEYFSEMSNYEIRTIAFEIATIGIRGINPNEKDYRVPSIRNKLFTGYQLLSYYYVSWALAIPEKLEDLKLPFDSEYELAKKMFGK